MALEMQAAPGDRNWAVEARGLVKSFGAHRAVNGLDLRVRAGTVYGILGPNGAGKTTTIRMLATLLRPDAGTAKIFGYDVVRQPQRVRQLISVTGQYASVDESLNAAENLMIFSRLLGLSRKEARRKTDELLEEFGLTEAAKRPLKHFSGGMRRRLDLAASLIVRPPLLFLDEPTTGLDPRTRNQMWETIRRLVKTGTTVLLTTQYLQEADELADRIAVIDRGRVVAEGTPDELKASVGRSSLQLRLRNPGEIDVARRIAERVLRTPSTVSAKTGNITVPIADASQVTDLLVALRREGIRLSEINVQKPTLDEVFLAITSHGAEKNRGGIQGCEGGKNGMSSISLPSVNRPPKNRAGFSMAVRQTLTMARRSLLKVRRTPEHLFDVTFQPILFILMFTYIFGGAVAGDAQGYLPMIVPAILIQTLVGASVASGVQLRDDMDKGVFDRFKAMPIARVAPLAGILLADMVRYAIAAVLTFGMGFLIGYRPEGGIAGVALAIVFSICCAWALSWIFAFFGVIARDAASVQGISMVVLFPLMFVSNAFVPVETMPGWLRWFAEINPISHMIAAVRGMVNQGTMNADFAISLLGAAAIVAIFAPIAVRVYMRRV